MAYLTKYNLSKLCQKLEVKEEISLDLFIEHIYNDKEIYYILNKREIEYLFIYKMVLEDENKFIVEYYNEVPEREDTKSFVFNITLINESANKSAWVFIISIKNFHRGLFFSANFLLTK